MYRDFPHHVAEGRMFEQHSQINHTTLTTNSEESIIEQVTISLQIFDHFAFLCMRWYYLRLFQRI